MKTPQRDDWLCYHLPENLCIHDALIARAPNMKELGWQSQLDRKASKGFAGGQSAPWLWSSAPLHGSACTQEKAMKETNAELATMHTPF